LTWTWKVKLYFHEAYMPAVNVPPLGSPLLRVDPIKQVDVASRILRAAWQKPCLDYEPELLAWHFKRPSDLAPISFIGYDKGEPAAFGAVLGHRVSVAGIQRDIYIASFFSAMPYAAPSLPIAVIRSTLRAVKETGIPCLVFAQAGSAGEKMLLLIRDYRQISSCTVFAGMAHGAEVGLDMKEADPPEWVAVYQSLASVNNAAIVPVFNFEHDHNHPWGRRLLTVYRRNIAVACAMQERTKLAGGSVQLSLHHVHAADAEALKALLAHCGGVTMLPNLTMPGFSLRSAGVHATASRYSAFLLGDLPATETRTEIV
jgi:hypothetical protein